MDINVPAIKGGKPVRSKPLRFGVPFIQDDEIEGVASVLRSGWITTGPKNLEFEEKFRDYVGAKYAIALSSCTDGMLLSLITAGVGRDDEVITSPLTFAATANVIIHCGAKPVFADVSETLNIDASQIERHITSKTRAIMPVHYAGQPCEMSSIIDIAKRNGLVVIEDAAHAMGAEYHGKKIGSIGDATCFSFHVQKNLTTAEGGMVTTDNEDWAQMIRILRLHGMTKDAWSRSAQSQVHYDVVYPGYKCNMTDIQAVIGLLQLNKLESFIETRRKLREIYDQAFTKMDEISLIRRIDNIRHSENMYVILLNLEMLRINRDEFITSLQAENIFCAVHFKPVHLHSYYAKTYGYKRGDYPNAERAFDRVVTLPLSPAMTEQDAYDVIEAVKRTVRYFRK